MSYEFHLLFLSCYVSIEFDCLLICFICLLDSVNMSSCCYAYICWFNHTVDNGRNDHMIA